MLRKEYVKLINVRCFPIDLGLGQQISSGMIISDMLLPLATLNKADLYSCSIHF